MRRALLILGSAAPIMLLIATSASACSWVLWARDVVNDRWDLVEGHTTLQDCQAGRAALLAMWKGKGWDVTAFVAQQIASDGQVSNLVMPVCAPDTVDPRAPKAAIAR
jgi:hypothetical protein